MCFVMFVERIKTEANGGAGQPWPAWKLGDGRLQDRTGRQRTTHCVLSDGLQGGDQATDVSIRCDDVWAILLGRPTCIDRCWSSRVSETRLRNSTVNA